MLETLLGMYHIFIGDIVINKDIALSFNVVIPVDSLTTFNSMRENLNGKIIFQIQVSQNEILSSIY